MSIDVKAVVAEIRAASKRAATEGAMAMHALAIPLTPFRDGDLRNSAFVKPAVFVNGGARALVYYNLAYAVYQHEGLPNKKHPGTQMKFLEAAMKDPAVSARIQQVMESHMKGIL